MNFFGRSHFFADRVVFSLDFSTRGYDVTNPDSEEILLARDHVRNLGWNFNANMREANLALKSPKEQAVGFLDRFRQCDMAKFLPLNRR